VRVCHNFRAISSCESTICNSIATTTLFVFMVALSSDLNQETKGIKETFQNVEIVLDRLWKDCSRNNNNTHFMIWTEYSLTITTLFCSILKLGSHSFARWLTFNTSNLVPGTAFRKQNCTLTFMTLSNYQISALELASESSFWYESSQMAITTSPQSSSSHPRQHSGTE